MPVNKDLGQMVRDYGESIGPDKQPKMKKEFMQVRLPLSIMDGKMPKRDTMMVFVIVGPVKGFEDTEHSKQVTMEARKGGVYMDSGMNLEKRMMEVFSKSNKGNK